MGFIDNFKEEYKKNLEKQKQKSEISNAQEQELQKKISKIKVTTGDIKKNYEIETVVFNIG